VDLSAIEGAIENDGVVEPSPQIVRGVRGRAPVSEEQISCPQRVHRARAGDFRDAVNIDALREIRGIVNEREVIPLPGDDPDDSAIGVVPAIEPKMG
jgi:hypothetical protein